jgi:hypothetical protein
MADENPIKPIKSPPLGAMRSERLESKRSARMQRARSTRSTSRTPGDTNNASNETEVQEEDPESLDMSDKEPQLAALWYSERKRYRCPVQLSAVKEGEDECPILMEPFQDCKMDFDPSLRYEEKDRRGTLVAYNRVTLEGCGHSFFPLALALHWMLHGMRCPMCKSGEDALLSTCSLPFTCIARMRRHVRKIREEIEEEALHNDLEIATRFAEEFDILHSSEDFGMIHDIMAEINDDVQGSEAGRRLSTGEILPTEMLYGILPIQDWGHVEFRIRLRVVMHYDRRSQQDLELALASADASDQWALTVIPSDSGGCTSAQLQGFLTLSEDPESSSDPTFSTMHIQRSQCRYISRIVQCTRPDSFSFNVCFQEEPHVIFMISQTPTMPAAPELSLAQPRTPLESHEADFTDFMRQLERTVNLTLQEDSNEVDVGSVTVRFMAEAPLESIEMIFCRVHRRTFISRVTKSKICMYLISNGLVESGSEFFRASHY